MAKNPHVSLRDCQAFIYHVQFSTVVFFGNNFNIALSTLPLLSFVHSITFFYPSKLITTGNA